MCYSAIEIYQNEKTMYKTIPFLFSLVIVAPHGPPLSDRIGLAIYCFINGVAVAVW